MANQVFANAMEISCKSASGKSICASPDVCFTPPQTPATPPGVPIPYPNTGMSSDTSNGSTSVNISGKEIMLKNKSYFSKSTGDEAGCAPKKGLVTSKNTGKVYFNMWSMDVKVEGENVVRHLDITTHNHASMPGNSPPMPYTDEMATGAGPDAQAETSCAIHCPSAGSPVNPVLGAKVLNGEEDLDFVLEGPLPLRWQRIYRSDVASAGWFGRGWRSPLEVALECVSDAHGRYVEEIVYVDAAGRRVRFEPLSLDQAHYSPHEQLTLLRDAGGVYSVTAADGTTWRFDRAEGAQCLLTRVSDRNGNAIDLDHGDDDGGAPPLHRTIAVRCSGGQRLEISLVGAHLREIVELRERDGAWMRIPLARYACDANGDVVRVLNRAGECMREFAYDAERRMIRQAYAGAFQAWYAYGGDGPADKVCRHWDNVGRSWTFEYGPHETRVTDQDGRVTCYHIDRQRRWIGTTDALGGVTTRGLDRFGNLRAGVDPGGAVTETVYDERGNAVEQHDPDGSVTLIEWHPVYALPVAVTDPLGRTTTYAYDDRGNLVKEIDAAGGETLYEVDAAGLAVAITDANGGTARIDYNERGQAVRYTDCSNFATTYDYDDNGWLACVIDATGATTRFAYDEAGRLRSHVLPDGTSESYTTDLAGRLLSVEDANGATTRYAYTPDGLLARRTDALGGTVEYDYDSARRLCALVDENGARHSFAYDALDRLVEETDGDGLRKQHAYDRRGSLVETIEASGSPQMIATRYEVDAAGRVTWQRSAGSWSSFDYDDAGQVTSARNPQVELSFEYDANGRLAAEHVAAAGHAYTVRYAYDAMGNCTQTALSDGPSIATLYYGSGHAHRVCVDGEPLVDIERDALHREVERSQGRLTTRRDYDVAGRLTWQCAAVRAGSTRSGRADAPLAGAVERRYRYDAGGRLAQQQDRGRTRSYAFDALDRLTCFDTERYAFDPAHNLSAKDGVQFDSRRNATGEPAVAGEVSYRYDAHGRLVSKREGAQSDLQLEWDDRHNLIGATRIDGTQTTCARYIYDPFGRRIAQRDERGETWFAWDGDRLLREDDGTTRTVFVYEPESYVPMAQVRAAREEEAMLAYYHCDQAGIPRELTDAQGEVVWEGAYSGWGQLTAGAAPSSHGEWRQPLRMQGQYFDEMTGLHYSRHRYYEPESGNFISKDPLGLVGGTNLYIYPRDPALLIDPLGLNVFPNNPGLVRRFMPCKEMKQMKKKGFVYDPKDPRGGISATSVNVPPCDPDKIRNRTGALGAGCYADINTKDLNVVLKGITKGGLPDWKIKDNVTPDRIVGSGKVRKKC